MSKSVQVEIGSHFAINIWITILTSHILVIHLLAYDIVRKCDAIWLDFYFFMTVELSTIRLRLLWKWQLNISRRIERFSSLLTILLFWYLENNFCTISLLVKILHQLKWKIIFIFILIATYHYELSADFYTVKTS